MEISPPTKSGGGRSPQSGARSARGSVGGAGHAHHLRAVPSPRSLPPKRPGSSAAMATAAARSQGQDRAGNCAWPHNGKDGKGIQPSQQCGCSKARPPDRTTSKGQMMPTDGEASRIACSPSALVRPYLSGALTSAPIAEPGRARRCGIAALWRISTGRHSTELGASRGTKTPQGPPARWHHSRLIRTCQGLVSDLPARSQIFR